MTSMRVSLVITIFLKVYHRLSTWARGIIVHNAIWMTQPQIMLTSTLGYLFHLLQHTGSTLSEVIFLEQVSTTNTDGSQNTGDPTKTEPDPAAQNKARYLVYILSNIIRNNPKVPRMLNNLSNRGNFTRGKKATDGNGKLSTEAKMRLQHTLLKVSFSQKKRSTSFWYTSISELTSCIRAYLAAMTSRAL